MVHHKFCKLIYFGGQKVKVTRHKNIAGVGHGTLVSAGFFYSLTFNHYVIIYWYLTIVF